jgi:hypothetical protein
MEVAVRLKASLAADDRKHTTNKGPLSVLAFEVRVARSEHCSDSGRAL